MEDLPDEVSLVPTEHVQFVLPEIMPLMERLATRMAGRYKVDDLIGFLLDGTLDLWVVLRGRTIIAFVATRIFEYPQARCFSLQFAAGDDMAAISEPLMRTFHDYARDTGCSEIEVLGRPGWARHLEPYGFRTAYVAVKKEI
jgi:hypothetical protein